MEPTDISSYEKTNEPTLEPDLFQQPAIRSPKPMIAGILLIMVGLLGLFTWTAVFAADPSVIGQAIPPGSPITAEQLQSVMNICAIVGSILSIFAILAGILAFKRKSWMIVLFGSILGVFTVGPLFLSTGLSIVALIIVVLSKKEFINTF